MNYIIHPQSSEIGLSHAAAECELENKWVIPTQSLKQVRCFERPINQC